MSDYLSDKEISDLTERIQRKAQMRQLDAMGITYRVRADFSLAVLRAHRDKMFGCQPTSATRRKTAPNWTATN